MAECLDGDGLHTHCPPSRVPGTEPKNDSPWGQLVDSRNGVRNDRSDPRIRDADPGSQRNSASVFRCQGEAGFMVGVLLSGLKRYYLLTQNDAVAEAIVGGARWLIDKTFDEVDEDFSTYSDLTIAQGQMRFLPGTKRNIKAFGPFKSIFLRNTSARSR